MKVYELWSPDAEFGDVVEHLGELQDFARTAYEFLATLARMHCDQELVDGHEFDMESDDAVEAINSAIKCARRILGAKP